MDAQTHYCLPGVDLEGFIDDVRKNGAIPMVLGIGDTVKV
jgi:hypothetical protein